MLKFDIPTERTPIIKVLGVGGGGSNAVWHMFEQGIQGVDFFICNTDVQSLVLSPVPNKIQLGNTGLGAGANPIAGREAAMQKAGEIKEILSQSTSMLFITAGMGGGTGTGAAPVIAQVAKELGILTVGIVTKPFGFEGRKRLMQAEAGIEELKKYVDTMLVICNDKLLDLQGDMKLGQAFGKADDVLTIAAKGIAEIITVTGRINVDFEDVKTVMRDSGKAIMGAGIASGPDRAREAVEMAMSSPLLDDIDIRGAENILLYITSGKNEISLEELNEITMHITSLAGDSANVIWGDGIDNKLEDEITVTLIATGFDKKNRVIHELESGNAQPVNLRQNYNIKQESVNTEIKLIEKTEVQKSIPTLESFIAKAESTVKQDPLTLFSSPEPKLEESPFVIREETFELKVEESTVKFEITNEKEPAVISEMVIKQPVSQTTREPEMESKRAERVTKLRDLSLKLSKNDDIEELEKQPAYMRRNVELSDIEVTPGSQVSRYSLHSDEQSTGLKETNSFFEDVVD